MQGLSSQQVEQRRKDGQGNDFKLKTSRTYGDIIKTNVFQPVYIVLYAIGLGMLAVGDTRSAIMVVGLIAFNAVVGIIQEVRSKHKLDEIALLAQAQVSVLRDGEEQQINPSELVLGDVLIVRAGDQVTVDGVVVGEGKIEADESALTCESDLILKS